MSAPQTALPPDFFRAEDYLRRRDLLTARGCHVPILAGLMPATDARQIARIEHLSDQPSPSL